MSTLHHLSNNNLMTTKEYDLYSAEFKKDPFPTYAEMRRTAPVHYNPGLWEDSKIWFVTGAKEVETVLRDHKTFVKNWRNTRTPQEMAELGDLSELDKLLDQHMLNTDGSDHTRLRSLVNKAFTPRIVNQMRGRVQEIADSLIEEFSHLGEADLIDAYAFPLPIVVIMDMLGIPVADRHKFRMWSHAFIAPASVVAASGYDQHTLLVEFTDFLREIFAERRALLRKGEPTDDLISALLAAEEAGDKLSEHELFAMVILLIVAGHETTTNLIGNGTLAFLRNPEQLNQLKADPSLIEAAVEEILRYNGPVDRATMRFAAEDTELAGQRIHRGDAVSVALTSANRDGSKFENADSFDITRSDNKHLGFGYGIHYCLGAQLARMEGAIAINTLFERLPDLTLAVDVNNIEWDTVPIIHGMKKLPVKWRVSK